MATAPPVITALPTPPDPNDRSTFNARAYPWSVAQQTLATEVGAVAANVYSNAQAAESGATAAANQVVLASDQAVLAQSAATAASATAGATQWASGATYAIGDCVWSPLNQQVYRRKFAGAGATDPSADTTNWAQVGGGSASLQRSDRTSNTILGASDKGKLIDITSGTFTQTFAAVATLGSGWFCYIRNSGTGDITLDPNASEQIDGLTSYVMYPGEVRLVQCDGVALRTVVLNSFYRLFTASGTFPKPPGYTAFGVDMISAGSGGGVGRGGGGGGRYIGNIASSALAASETIIVGSGGMGSASTTINAGGDSIFGGVTVYGSKQFYGATYAGSGGTASENAISPSPSASGLQGGYGSNTGIGGNAEYGGAGGGCNGGGSTTGGKSLFGGGGGAGGPTGVGNGGAGGINPGGAMNGSGAGGNGQNASNALYCGGGGGGGSTTGGNGGIPAGGGGAGSTAGGSGARGEIRIWGII